MLSSCIDVYKKFEGGAFNEFLNVPSMLKNKKINIKNELFEKHKKLTPDFEQNLFSLTWKRIYRVGHDAIRFLKGMGYYHR